MAVMMMTALPPALLAATPAVADKGAVLDTYADTAQATSEDSLSTAQTFPASRNALIGTPSSVSLWGQDLNDHGPAYSRGT